VQQAIVECHGSQCGFCTPGFVMSLWAVYEQHRAAGTRPSRQQLADALSGNLCRCTGYRPILAAGQRMFELEPAPLQTAPVVAALESLRGTGSFAYAARGASYEAPRTIAELAAARAARPHARLLAGSTDVGLWVTKMLRELPDLVFTGEVAELRRIAVADGSLSIGAAVSLEDAYAALSERWPALREIWLRFASVPIRNAGTLGGNVANGSPIGDSAPVLMALDARLVLRNGERLRTLPLDDFYTGYMQNRLEPGEFVQAIEVPLDATPTLRAYKISKRFDSDISAVCAALALRLEDGVVRSARLAFGGMAATVRRATGAEAALIGQPWTEAALAAAQQALATDFVPLSDMRASAAYRMQVAQNLLRRFWLETRAEAPLSTHDVSVWELRA
jgi:xanthine dehydrogenase small subunit